MIKKQQILNGLKKYIGNPNIADEFYTPDSPQSDEMRKLDEIGNLVVTTTKIDKDSRQEYEENMSEAFKLIKTSFEKKNIPWEGAANIKYPLTMGACIQFNARTLPEIVKNDKVVSVKNMRPDPAKNQQPMQMPQGQQGMPMQGMQPPAQGMQPPMQQGMMQPNIPVQQPIDSFQDDDRADRLSGHMSYQLIGQSKHWLRDTDKLLMALPMLGVVFRKSFYNSIKKQPDTQFIVPEDLIVNNSISSLDEAMRITHIMELTSNELREYMNAGLFLEYTQDELQQAFTEQKEQRVDDSKIAGMQQESYTENEELKNKIYDEIHTLYEQHRYLDLDGDGYQEPYIVTIHKESSKILRIVARYDEDSFEFDDNDNFIKINPDHYFTDYHFIPNPDGSYYSFGFGLLLMPINSTINSILNNLIDAGTLANMQGGWVSKDVRKRAGDLRFKPGEWKEMTMGMGGKLADNIFPLPIKEPSATLFTLLQFLIESAKEITSISDVMQGEMPPPNTPVGTVTALVEQGQKVYGVILYRIYNALKEEFNKLYKLNQKYLLGEEMYYSATTSGIIQPADYTEDHYGIFPVADPQVGSSMQRLLQAQAVMQLLQDQPYINTGEALKNYMEALKIKDIDKLLIENPPPAPPSPDDQLKMAQASKTHASIGTDLLDQENKHHANLIKDKEIQSKSAYMGGKLAGEKVNSIVKLAEGNISLGEHEMAIAEKETEQLTAGTQMQTYPIGAQQTGQQQEAQIEQTQQEAQPQQPQGQQGAPQIPPGLMPGGGEPQ